MSGFPGSSSFRPRAVTLDAGSLNLQMQRAPVKPPSAPLPFAPPKVRPQHLDIRGGSPLRGFQPFAQRGAATSAIVRYDAKFAARQLGGGTAAGVAKSRALTGILGAAGVVLLAADVMELYAPGVQNWLTGGWKGASGRGLPESSQEVPAAPAQGVGVQYKVTYTLRRNGQIWLNQKEIYFRGPFVAIEEPSPSNDYYPAVRVLAGQPAVYWSGNDSVNTFFSPTFTLENVSFQRLESGTDPATTTVFGQNPIEANPQPRNSPYIPEPKRPDPTRNLESTDNLSRLFNDEVKRRNDRTYTPPSYRPGADPVPSSGSSPTQRPELPPANTSSAPKNRPPRVIPTDGVPEVGTKLERRLDDIDEALEKLKLCACPDNKTGGSGSGLVWRYPVVRCINGEVSIEQRVIQVAAMPPASFLEEIRQMANAAATVCAGNAPPSVPDYWQVKAEAQRPQLELTFRSAGTSTYLSLCIPHPASDKPWTQNLFTDYEAGNFAGILKLKDNSSLVVNAASVAEANRVLDKMLTLVKPSMIPESPERRVVERRGQAVKSAKKLLRKVAYFKTGQRNLVPDWFVKIPIQNIR